MPYRKSGKMSSVYPNWLKRKRREENKRWRRSKRKKITKSQEDELKERKVGGG